MSLALYETVASASTRMLDAARAGDWEAFAAHEQSCSAAIDVLRAQTGAALDTAELERKSEIIRQVLAQDAEIRRLAQPWLERMEALLNAVGNRRRVDAAYG